MKQRSEIPRMSPKQEAKLKAKNGGRPIYSTIAPPDEPKCRQKKFTPAIVDGLKAYASMPRRSTELPPRTKRIPKSNHARQAKSGKRYQAGLATYRASEAHAVVEARAAGRCEFAIALDPTRLPRVLDVRIDRALPAGYERSCTRRGRQHHHCSYVRFGGDELPEDMLVGCPGCHEYVEAMKAAHRSRRALGGA